MSQAAERAVSSTENVRINQIYAKRFSRTLTVRIPNGMPDGRRIWVNEKSTGWLHVFGWFTEDETACLNCYQNGVMKCAYSMFCMTDTLQALLGK